MTMPSPTAPGPTAGVNVAEVNLKFIWDVVSQIKIGQAGYAYVVDATGRLIAHPDISLVLQQTDLSALAAGAGARAPAAKQRPSPADRARSTGADRPRGSRPARAGRSLSSSRWRRRSRRCTPHCCGRCCWSWRAWSCRSWPAWSWPGAWSGRSRRCRRGGADRQRARSTSGSRSARGDELESLARRRSTTMTGQLRESYATLEQKVEERTRDLADALGQLRALGEVSQAVNSSLDLQDSADHHRGPRGPALGHRRRGDLRVRRRTSASFSCAPRTA